jgi:hypothetical protein
MKNAIFWDVTPCRSCENRRFGGTYRLHLQGRKIRERGTSVSRCLETEPLGEDRLTQDLQGATPQKMTFFCIDKIWSSQWEALDVITRRYSSEYLWIRIEAAGRLTWTRQWNFGFHKWRRISWLDEELLLFHWFHFNGFNEYSLVPHYYSSQNLSCLCDVTTLSVASNGRITDEYWI